MSRPASEVEATDESDSSHDTNSRAKYKLERSKQEKLEETMRKSSNNGVGKESHGRRSLSREERTGPSRPHVKRNDTSRKGSSSSQNALTTQVSQNALTTQKGNDLDQLKDSVTKISEMSQQFIATNAKSRKRKQTFSESESSSDSASESESSSSSQTSKRKKDDSFSESESLDNVNLTSERHDVEDKYQFLDDINEKINEKEESSHDPVSEKLANIVKKRWGKLIPSEKLKKLHDNYKRPENCTQLIVPRVNRPVWMKLARDVKEKDRRIAHIQENVVAATAAVVQATDMLFAGINCFKNKRG